MRGDVRDACGLTGCVRSEPGGAAQIPGRTHGMTARRASLHHPDLATHPGPRMLDRLAWSRILRSSRLEEVQHVLGTGRGPQREELVIGIGERAATADRH